nr:hypothetical protein SHINE37_44494 [Rhizobiaceae bacterium]
MTFPGFRKTKSRLSAACRTIGISHWDVNKIAPEMALNIPQGEDSRHARKVSLSSHTRPASWGKLRNRFARIPATLVTESTGL